QAGVLSNHQEQGAIHERGYDDRTGGWLLARSLAEFERAARGIAQNKSKLNPARDRLVGFSAIGQSLKGPLHRPRAIKSIVDGQATSRLRMSLTRRFQVELSHAKTVLSHVSTEGSL